ncbi:MAG: LD-carboxypeptidase [Bacteroidales bacterium]|nr:LD-carboxypeptidase [Candidatus Sodaliphilus aphodohippi]
MIRQIITFAAALAVSLTALAGTPVAPAFLKPGDKIAIMSLASTPGNVKYADKAADLLRQWGFTVEVSTHVMDRYHGYAGSDKVRAAELMKYLRDPEVKAIISTRGGYGSAQLLSLIPSDTLRRYPKWIVGYSDITSMHSAQVAAGNMSIHGNMGGYLSSATVDDRQAVMMKDILLGKMPTYTAAANALNHNGKAKGTLVGGNMYVMSKIAGSEEFDFLYGNNVDGDLILFFEDVSETMPHVAAMLQQMKLRGFFKRVKGIIVGRFTDYKTGYDYRDMNEMIHEMLGDVNIPVCYDFPTGHDESYNLPLIEGHKVTLDVSPLQVTLDFK